MAGGSAQTSQAAFKPSQNRLVFREDCLSAQREFRSDKAVLGRLAGGLGRVTSRRTGADTPNPPYPEPMPGKPSLRRYAAFSKARKSVRCTAIMV
ncbi:hypothetical protein FHR99_002808 [Litorivivens lipolytica]|uniref:Uncharacterized protein n=1 Tax=Litorivivens lipolytica TaxID=1524264 RepID=A0A7W4W6W0_9GAMM|nr:hypothetical protein [Litorivivens lipolytica]MBB3048534.1 hypothetical protein [Litorivivens lipolytica]